MRFIFFWVLSFILHPSSAFSTPTQKYNLESREIMLAQSDERLAIIDSIHAKSCRLLNQGYTFEEVSENVRVDVNRLDNYFVSVYSNLSRNAHGEVGSDKEIVSRRIIGGAIKSKCPQYLDKISDAYRKNSSWRKNN